MKEVTEWAMASTAGAITVVKAGITRSWGVCSTRPDGRARGGDAAVDNELFHRDHSMMLRADAKKMAEEIVKALG